MNISQSSDQNLNDFARFVADTAAKPQQNPNEKSGGSLITEKALSVLRYIQENRSTLSKDKEQFERMRVDAKRVHKQVTDAKGGLWHDHEVKEGLPAQLHQTLASIINSLTFRSLLLADVSTFYHGELIAKALEGKEAGSAQKFVRTYTETLLTEAYNKDKKAHYLLRDPTTVTDQPDKERIVLSHIAEDGKTMKHDLLVYTTVEGKKCWINETSRMYSESIASLIKDTVKNGTGVANSEKRMTDFSGSYGL